MIGRDNKELNKMFAELLKKVEKKRVVDESMKELLYFFFICGYNLNSGNTQLVT